MPPRIVALNWKLTKASGPIWARHQFTRDFLSPFDGGAARVKLTCGAVFRISCSEPISASTPLMFSACLACRSCRHATAAGDMPGGATVGSPCRLQLTSSCKSNISKRLKRFWKPGARRSKRRSNWSCSPGLVSMRFRPNLRNLEA